jgi:hypothetical protein
MTTEKLVEWWLAGETEVLGEILPPCRFVHHKLYMPFRARTRAAAVGSQRLTAWATARPWTEYKEFFFEHCVSEKMGRLIFGSLNRKPIAVAARPTAWTVFARSNAGIVSSNPTQGMDVCVYSVCACTVCVGFDGLIPRPKSLTDCV